MAVLTVVDVTEAGVTDGAASAAGGGDSFANPDDERTILCVINGGGSPITVTITPQTTAAPGVPGYGDLTKGNGGGSVTNGTRKFFGPFPARTYNDANGRVLVTYSGVTSVTVAVLRIPKRG